MNAAVLAVTVFAIAGVPFFIACVIFYSVEITEHLKERRQVRIAEHLIYICLELDQDCGITDPELMGLALPKLRGIRWGPPSKMFAEGYGCCGKCGTPWKFVTPHSTEITLSRGVFCLCEKCWEEIEPHQRLPFYAAAHSRCWRESTDWNRLANLVMAGG